MSRSLGPQLSVGDRVPIVALKWVPVRGIVGAGVLTGWMLFAPWVRVDRLGGTVDLVAAARDSVFVGGGIGVARLAYADEFISLPEEVAEGEVVALAANEDWLVAASEGAVRVWRLDSEAPKYMGQRPTAGAVADLAVDGSTAYIALESLGVGVLQLHDPLGEIARTLVPGGAKSVAAESGVAYMVGSGPGLWSIESGTGNVTQLAETPERPGELSLRNGVIVAQDDGIRGVRAYHVDGAGVLEAGRLEQIRGEVEGVSVGLDALAAVVSIGYEGFGQHALLLLDLSEETVEQIAAVELGDRPFRDVAASRDWWAVLYATGHVDIVGPAGGAWGVQASGSAVGPVGVVSVADSIAYVASGIDEDLMAVTLGSRGPTIISRTVVPGVIRRLASNQSQVVVSSVPRDGGPFDEILAVYERDGSRLAHEYTMPLRGIVAGLVAGPSRIYALVSTSDLPELDRRHVVWIDSSEQAANGWLPTDASALAVDGSLLLTAQAKESGRTQLEWFSHDAQELRSVRTESIDETLVQVAVAGSHLLGITGTELIVAELSTPSRVVGRLSLFGDPLEIIARDNIAVVVLGRDGGALVDFGDPTDPQLVYRTTTVWDAALGQNLAMLAQGEEGVGVYVLPDVMAHRTLWLPRVSAWAVASSGSPIGEHLTLR